MTAAESQCTKQSHYDWGMRMTKTIVSRASHVLANEMDPDPQRQVAILAEALQDELSPRLTNKDKPVVAALITQYFCEPPLWPQKLRTGEHWPRSAAIVAHMIDSKEGWRSSAMMVGVAPHDE